VQVVGCCDVVLDEDKDTGERFNGFWPSPSAAVASASGLTSRTELRLGPARSRLSISGIGATFSLQHATVYDTFNVCRHLTTASTHRILRECAFDPWRVAVAASA
jgi:hypothetical protein